MDFERLVHDYVVWHEVSGHSAKTIAWYRWVLGTFHRWLVTTGRPTTIAQITIADVRAFLQAETHRDTLYPGHAFNVERPGRLSDRTLHCYARAIRAFFNWLVAEEYLASNPLGRLKPPKLEKRFKVVLSVAGIEQLLAVLHNLEAGNPDVTPSQVLIGGFDRTGTYLMTPTTYDLVCAYKRRAEQGKSCRGANAHQCRCWRRMSCW